MDGENTAPKTRQLAPAWQPGQSGNPNGRPKGARNKLGEAFIQALHDDFNEHGVAAVVEVREKRPHEYLRVIASLMPKELTLNLNDDYNEMTDDELIDRIRRLQSAIAPFLDAGTGDVAGGVGAATREGKSPRVH